MKKIKFLLLLSAIISANTFAQFKLAPLPYSYSALEPYIDSVTMRIHYTAHHQAYANNLNKALEKYPQWKNQSIENLLKNLNRLPLQARTAIRNNGGGFYNHTLFWTMLAPAGTTSMSEQLEKAIIRDFGSVEKFKETFEKEAGARFGSGWVWLVKQPNGKLKITSTANQDNLFTSNIPGRAILGLDVWEHAYYLKYQSKRAAYTKAFWNVVNWNKVSELYK